MDGGQTALTSTTACNNHRRFASHAHVDKVVPHRRSLPSPPADGVSRVPSRSMTRTLPPEQGYWNRSASLDTCSIAATQAGFKVGDHATPLDTCLQTASSPNRLHSALATGPLAGIESHVHRCTHGDHGTLPHWLRGTTGHAAPLRLTDQPDQGLWIDQSTCSTAGYGVARRPHAIVDGLSCPQRGLAMAH